MNTQGLGKRQRDALEFIQGVDGWTGYADDVRRVVLSLKARGLVLVDERTQQFAFRHRLRCDSCQMAWINGLPCHETGCLNTRRAFDPATGRWESEELYEQLD